MAKAIRKKTAERRRYTAEYRREALLLADKVGVAEAAKQLGLHESQLYSWRSKDRLERSQSDVEKQQALEIVRLKRQLAEKTEDLTILKKRPRTLPRGAEEATTAKYAFMIAMRGEFTVIALCRALDVSPSAFHAWRRRRDQGRNHGAGSPAIQTLTMALWRRGFPKGVLSHTDRGSQYCSDKYQDLLVKHKLVCSMSGTGNCFDNACA